MCVCVCMYMYMYNNTYLYVISDTARPLLHSSALSRHTRILPGQNFKTKAKGGALGSEDKG